MEMKSAIKLICYGFCIGIIMWFICSTVEVWTRDLDTDYEYSKANVWEATVDSNSETETNVVSTEAPTTEEPTKDEIKNNTVHVKVVDCIESYGDYEVTVEDSEGNLWAYYDTEWLPNGYPLRATFNGDEIVDVAYQKGA